MSESNLVSEYLDAIRKGAVRDRATIETVQVNATDEKQQLEIDGLKSAFNRLGDIHKARMYGLCMLFILVLVWLMIILKFVYWTGTPSDWNSPVSANGSRMILKLSDSVIIALISSTTVNVVALFVIAAKWLYGNQKSNESSDSN
jgi:ABC-type Fe3+ transport system permease subunit